MHTSIKSRKRLRCKGGGGKPVGFVETTVGLYSSLSRARFTRVHCSLYFIHEEQIHGLFYLYCANEVPTSFFSTHLSRVQHNNTTFYPTTPFMPEF